MDRFVFPGMCLIALCLGACTKASPPVASLYPELPAEQIVTTLEKIAETGEYKSVSMSLTASLEKAGYMREAATVQNFQYADSPEKVKAMAAELVNSVKKRPAGQG